MGRDLPWTAPPISGQSRIGGEVPNFLGLLVTSSVQNPDKYFPTRGISSHWPWRPGSHTGTTEWDGIMPWPLTLTQTSHPALSPWLLTWTVSFPEARTLPPWLLPLPASALAALRIDGLGLSESLEDSSNQKP